MKLLIILCILIHTCYAQDFNPYKILNLNPDATTSEIRKEYYKLARTYHPDKNKTNPNAEEIFKRINEAHETLIDPEKRANYDWQNGNINPTSILNPFTIITSLARFFPCTTFGASYTD